MNISSSLNNLQVFQEQKTVGVSPWVLALKDELGEDKRGSRWSHVSDDFSFSLVEGKHSLWLITRFPAGGEVALRVAYCPDGHLAINNLNPIENGVEIDLFATIGKFCVRLEFPQDQHTLLHFKTTLTPSAPLIMPFWPRDVIPLGEKSNLTAPEGMIYTSQIGLRSGLTYFSLTSPKAGAVLYFQNLTSLNDYCMQTETSLAEVVGGTWPEMGLALPTTTDKSLKEGEEIIISDAYVIFSLEAPEDDLAMSRQFLELLAQIYLALPRPATEYTDWLDVAKNSLRDLSHSEKCWTEEKGQYYLTAYVGDYENPPESMVQLTVLLPLLEYADWSGKEVSITEDLLPGLPKFFDKNAGVLGRWLPSAAGRLDGSEPQKKPEVMDSWYLFHSLINLSRLALHGDKKAKKLFVASMDTVSRRRISSSTAGLFSMIFIRSKS